MNRSMVGTAAFLSAALGVGALTVGVLPMTAVAFMVLYALHALRTA